MVGLSRFFLMAMIHFFLLGFSQGKNKKAETFNNGEMVIITRDTLINGRQMEVCKKYTRNKTFIGVYYQLNGKLEGEYQDYYESGKLKRRGRYVDGELYGENTHFYENGNVMHLVHFRNSLREGVSRGFYENGRLHSITTMKEGRQEGIYTEYFENGKIKTVGNHKSQLEDGIWKYYYENGKIKEIRNIIEGCSHGLTRYYYETGILSAVGNYKRNSDKFVCAYEDGVWKYFDEKGRLKQKIKYKEGERVETESFQ